MRRLLVPFAVVALLVLARAYLATEGSTPPDNPRSNTWGSADALKAHFNRDPSQWRVLMLLAPSCWVCLKGARVIEETLQQRANQAVAVFVVWQPIAPWKRWRTDSPRSWTDHAR